MSDSDDTDALLLVPPDFFYIHSDSEDNLFCDVSRVQNSELERMVVSDLIDHVSELENRVHVIEQKDSLTPYHHKIFDNQCWDHTVDALHSLDSLHLSQYNCIHSESLERTRNFCTICQSTVNVPASHVNHRFALPLPSSTSAGHCVVHQQPLECSDQPDSPVKQFISEDGKPIAEVTTIMMQPRTVIEDVLSQETTEGSFSSAVKASTIFTTQNNFTPCKTKRQDLMSEIDEFLNSIKKQQPERVQENNSVSSNASHSWSRNFESSSFPFIPHLQTFPGIKHYGGLNTEVKALALSDVGQLLDEVEMTQTEIVHKLQETNKLPPEKAQSLRVSLNTNGSQPTLDFNEPSNSPYSSLISSAVAETVKDNTFDVSKLGCCQTEDNGILTVNVQDGNCVTALNKSGLKSVRRRLDMGCDFSPSNNMAKTMTEVSDDAMVVGSLLASSSTTLAPSLPSTVSTSQVSSTINNVSAPDRKGDSSDLPQLSSHILDHNHFQQDNRTAVACTSGGPTFATHTYLPGTSGKPCSGIAGSSVLQTQSLEPGARFGFVQAVPMCAASEVRRGGVISSDTAKAFPSSDIDSAASGDHNRKEPLKLIYENDPAMTKRAMQGNANLLSLSELWIGEELSGPNKEDVTNPARRLEEERYRRQHCERLIRQLQSRLLEEQQKVAVAVEVDRAKDRAILQLQAGWRQLVGHWRELEEQRHSVTNTLHQERESFQHDLAQSSQKVKHLERELSRMLDLAQDYKEKSENLCRESDESKRKHQLELQEASTRVQQLEQALSSTSELLKGARAKEEELMGQLQSIKQDVLKEIQAKEAVLVEMEQSREALGRLEAELLAVKEEKASLQMKIKEEKNRNSLLDKQKKALQIAVDDLKKKEKAGREEVRVMGDKLERAKLELRDHYQQQVEKVVQEKMREFQTQLDADVTSMRTELQQRERAVTELAAQQIKQIADKHEVEMQLLEEKHQEEKRLLRLQLSQSMQKVADLQEALTQLRSQRGQVAERLRVIMEAQWRESVRVVAGASPVNPHKQVASEQTWEVMPPLPLHNLERSGSSSTTDSVPFGQDGQLTYRVNNQPQQPAPPLQPDKGDELKKYIAMLLDCKPGNPVGERSEIPTSECGHIPARTQQEYLGVRLESREDRNLVQGQAGLVCTNNQESQTGKPPWK